jgi:subtilisin family serine protease
MYRTFISTFAVWLLSTTAALAQETRVVVIFHDTPDETVITGRGGSVEVRSDRSRLLAARIAPNKVADLAADENVACVAEDCEGRLPAEPKAKPGSSGAGPAPAPQPAQGTPWGIARIDAEAAWATTVGTGVKVAIVDTGIKNDHLDLRDGAGASRVILGPNFVNAMKSSADDHGHGTHCAGIAGAGNNTIGVVGVAPDCTLVAVKVLDKNGRGWSSGIIAGIDWAATNADVISMSLGFMSNPAGLQDSVDSAVAGGVPVVVSGGNEGDAGSPPSWPAAYASVIAVAATDVNDNVAFWSTKASYIDIAAPGVSVYSTWKDGYYRTLSGTSMACPHVSGAAALLIGKGVTAVADIRTALLSKADDINSATSPGFDNEIGNGLLDVEESVTNSSSAP